MPEPLNTYESRLLTQLQDHLIEQSQRAPARRRSPAAKVGWAVAAGAAVVAGAIGITQLSAQPAWAVDPHPDGTVTITVNRPEGAAQLESRLKEMGINADVQFPPEGRRCRPNRITKTNAATEVESQVIEGATMGHDQVTVEVRPSRMTKGTTLLLEVSALDHISETETGGSVGIVGVIRGAAPTCDLVPLTAEEFATPPGSTR